jgi:hypothetical protein
MPLKSDNMRIIPYSTMCRKQPNDDHLTACLLCAWGLVRQRYTDSGLPSHSW